MIVLDTHVWVWWVHGAADLPPLYRTRLADAEYGGDTLGVSIISCWEVAKLVERGRLGLPCDVTDWLRLALGYPGVQLLPLTSEIVVDATCLPGDFHRDPADQLLVATARCHGSPLMTCDRKITGYPHVETL